ncbi:MAG: VOC family protein [Candidatus Kapaibacteriota bacterium]
MNTASVRLMILGSLSIVAVCSLVYAFMAYQGNDNTQRILASSINAAQVGQKNINNTPNPVAYFEIPVLDMERAVRFYSKVFDTDFTHEKIDGNEMALFPLDKVGSGVSGALAKGEIYKPSTSGTLVYFQTQDIDKTLRKVQELECKVLYPKTSVGGNGFVAEFQDTEGNRIALISHK